MASSEFCLGGKKDVNRPELRGIKTPFATDRFCENKGFEYGRTTDKLSSGGFLVKSIVKSPSDSRESKIPSLSLSKSILSTTPSLSESLGQMLTLTADEYTMLLGDKQSITTSRR